MRRTLAMLLALTMTLTVAGCAGDAATQADAARSECQRRAVDDPAVQAAIVDANSPLQEVRVQGVHDQEVAMRRAVQRCLAARNGQPVGGVEPVQGQWLGPPIF